MDKVKIEKKEVAFGKIFGEEGKDFWCASDKANKDDHWDIGVTEDAFNRKVFGVEHHLPRIVDSGDLIRIDVKHQTAYNKDGKKDYRIIELTNVRGNDGWLYGKAHYIAFKDGDSWLFVEREKLRKWVEEHNEGTALTRKEYMANPRPYLRYTRETRKDIITRVPLTDLRAMGKIIDNETFQP